MMTITRNLRWQAPRLAAAQIKLLERLSNASAAAPNEAPVRKIVLEQITPFVDDAHVDALGNVLATKKGRGANLPRVMVAAHMDEVGLILTADEGEGVFRFELVGNVDERYLPGKPVWVGPKQIPGVIGAKAIHLTTASERQNKIGLDSLRVDLGPGNGGKAKIGDWATFATKFQRIGPSLRGKALDDRIGVATLIELVKNSPPNINVLAAFTVQEEVGLRGARVAGYAMNPDMAIVLDCTPAMDQPSWDGGENTLYRSQLDHGPAIYVADSGTLYDPRLVAHLQETADAYGIPYQIRQPGGGGTDAGNIHKQRAGIPTAAVSVPGRYLHTPASIVRLNDWKNTLALVHAALSHIDKSTLKGTR